MMKVKPLTRSVSIERMDSMDDESRTIEIAFSSEEPYERYFGMEILDHSDEAVDLARLNGKAPVLVNHDPDQQVGVIESARIDGDRKGRAVVRFGKSERASEIWQDVKDGIRSLVSVGYRINEMVLEKRGDNGTPDEYRVTRWMPAEVSIVAVPADATVGVGRAFESQTENDCEVIMNPENKPQERQQPAPEQPKIDVGKIEAEVRQAELKRCSEIRAMGDKFGVSDLAAKFIEEGKKTDEMRNAVLDHLAKNGSTTVQPNAQQSDASPDLSKKELEEYSIVRAVNAYVSGDWKKAGLERECSMAMADRIGKDAKGFYVPTSVFAKDQKRTLDSTTATTAAELVGTDHRGDLFIDLLRSRTVVMEAGATMMTGLVGNVDIPRLDAGASFQWLAEGGDVTPDDLNTGTVSLTPKTVAGAGAMTRRLLQQSSPSVDRVVTNDLLSGIARAIDLAALVGGGANQPTGIASTAGIGSVTLGAGTFTRANAVDLLSEVAVDNADIGALRYIMNAAQRGTAMKTQTDAGSGLFVMDSNDDLLGYPVSISNQMANDTVIFGNFNDVLIGMWSGIDLKPDEYALAASGGLVLRVFVDMDVALRHPQSFSYGATA